MYSVCLGVLCSVCRSNWILIFFSLVLFSAVIHNKRKKFINNYFWIKRSKDTIYLFCCQGYLKHFLENYVFCRKSGNDTCSRRWARGKGHVVCVIMTHCIQKLICQLTPYILTLLKLLKKWSMAIMIKTVSQLISP